MMMQIYLPLGLDPNISFHNLQKRHRYSSCVMDFVKLLRIEVVLIHFSFMLALHELRQVQIKSDLNNFALQPDISLCRIDLFYKEIKPPFGFEVPI
jgi:hypothetical protein